MQHNHSPERIKKMCAMLGEDFDSPACQSMQEQINACPNCKIYYDTIKKTVLLCQENDCAEKLPKEVHNRLLHLLDLDQFIGNK
jgi:hypothetical protein